MARAPAAPPARANMQVVAVPDLPRVNPFHLERGPEAMQRAASALRVALDLPAVLERAGGAPVSFSDRS